MIAWNQDETVSSRGARPYEAPAAGSQQPPELYAIVVGISEYAAPSLRLRYAAKDANDMAKAIELGARSLFGAERVHVTRLVTGDPSVKPPTRSNLEEAFTAVRRARAEDVLVVYFAGHGTAIANDYVYPTRDATTVFLNDSESRKRDAVMGSDLAEWTRMIPALKQVMVLDTCAAGAAAAHLQPSARSERSSIVRALERLSSRTGFHVLMGSAADALSYESDGLGQGLLTYTLLQGMKGAALRDGEFADVQKLFQHAADRVPLLAKDRSRVQRPQIAAPRGLTFDFGRFGPAERDAIRLPPRKPIVLRPLVLNARARSDDLALTIALKNALRERSYAESDIEFVDADEYPGGVRPEGMYEVHDSRAVVSLVLKRDGEPVAPVEVDGAANDVQSLAEKLVTAICGSVTDDPR